MGADHFVGRGDAITRLRAVLSGDAKAPDGGRLTVPSVEGPGGIGKTSLFDHALRGVDLAARKYLTLRIDGREQAAGPDRGEADIVRAVARMADGAAAAAIVRRPPGYYFPAVDRVVQAVDAVRSRAAAEFGRHPRGDDAGRAALGRLMNAAIAAGRRINEVSPVTRRYLDVARAEADVRLAGDIVGNLAALADRRRLVPWGRSAAFANGVLKNPLERLADALAADLAALLRGYRREDWWRPTHAKVPGVSRLLLVVDDYEFLHRMLGEFLLAHLLPRLRTAAFESTVVVLGRDKLAATHPRWAQHFDGSRPGPIELPPLARPEMDALVAAHGSRTRPNGTGPGGTPRGTRTTSGCGSRRPGPAAGRPSCSSSSTTGRPGGGGGGSGGGSTTPCSWPRSTRAPCGRSCRPARTPTR